MSTDKRKAHKERYISAIPKVLILWSTFAILFTLNRRFVILAYFATTFYNVYSTKEIVLKKYVKACGLHYIIALLAVLTASSLLHLILINALVTFAICFYFCTDISPNGYIVYLIEFIFLQMHPFKISQIPSLLIIMTIIFIGLFIILWVRQYIHNKNKEIPKFIRMALKDIADYFKQLAEHPEDIEEITGKIEVSSNDFFSRYYNSFTFPETITTKSFLDYFMIVILNRIKRMSKLIAEPSSTKDKLYLQKLSQLFENCYQNINPTDNQFLLDELSLIKANYTFEQSNINKHLSVIFALLEKIIRAVVDEKSLEIPRTSGVTIARYYIKRHGFRHYFIMNKFRISFALRMTVVAVAMWVLSRYIPSYYSYWLPLNTLIVLNPTYEVSRKAYNDRTLGVMLGCICIFILLYLLPFQWTPIVLFLLCSAIFYCWVPKQWSTYIWSGIYGTSMLAYSMEIQKVVELKMLFLVIGYVVSALANRYLFSKPTNVMITDNLRKIGILLSDELNLMTELKFDKQGMVTNIYWMMQLHFTMEQIVKLSNEQQGDNIITSCNSLKELSDAIQNIIYMMITLDDQTEYLPHIDALKERLNQFVAQDDKNVLLNIDLLNQIQAETNEILADLKKEQHIQDAFVFAE